MVECSICYSVLDVDVTIMRCEHKFHRNCINEWLKYSNTCPLCRRVMEYNINDIYSSLIKNLDEIMLSLNRRALRGITAGSLLDRQLSSIAKTISDLERLRIR